MSDQLMYSGACRPAVHVIACNLRPTLDSGSSHAAPGEGGHLAPRPCSPEEAARYLETYKTYEHKPAEVLMERKDSDFSSLVGPRKSVCVCVCVHACVCVRG